MKLSSKGFLIESGIVRITRASKLPSFSLIQIMRLLNLKIISMVT